MGQLGAVGPQTLTRPERGRGVLRTEKAKGYNHIMRFLSFAESENPKEFALVTLQVLFLLI